VKLSVAMPPGPDAVEFARLAESLGYDRIWFYDSAALYEDIWITLGRVAEQTTINLGTAVLVPNLRHAMTTAAAIATIERLAPGRLACGFGTGATARWVLNKPALSWASTRRYVEQVHGLLHGEVVAIDGEPCQMIHHDRWATSRPIETPLLLSALGPKGVAITRELCDAGVTAGVIGFGPTEVPFEWHAIMVAGTVLAPGEAVTSERVKQALGPWYVLRYHGTWQLFPDAIPALPLGADWLADIESERPARERHLAVHTGHVTDVVAHDDKLLDAATADDLTTAGWVGTAEELRSRAEGVAAQGVTELLYTPAGPDIAGQMESFASAILS
jgi:5,10-methylenetetrahydromethanopterin reductase